MLSRLSFFVILIELLIKFKSYLHFLLFKVILLSYYIAKALSSKLIKGHVNIVR